MVLVSSFQAQMLTIQGRCLEDNTDRKAPLKEDIPQMTEQSRLLHMHSSRNSRSLNSYSKVTLHSGGEKLHSFFLCHGFVPLGFPGKVFNDAVPTDRISYSFSFTRFLSHWVFSSKVLTRHILNGHPRGNVMKYYNWMSIGLPLSLLNPHS